jgi:pyruvyl transferase EpsO
MNFNEKIKQLSQIIDEQLLPIINRNTNKKECVFLELPYYNNIGDILIWHGTEYFIKRIGLKCMYASSSSTYCDKKMKKITDCRNDKDCRNILILLQGGGNFGDIWKSAQEFRRKIISEFPDNQIIILPQTVFYEDIKKLKADAELFAKHTNLTICARDKISYQILKKYFRNDIILVPDMAFCIPQEKLKKYTASVNSNTTLLLKRTDKEIDNKIDYSKNISCKVFDICDWPTMERMTFSGFILRCFSWVSRRISFIIPCITDIYASNVFKHVMIKTGVRFISKYNNVYSTRLHAAILCCLLEKSLVFFDNSYGKNSSFYETWLSDLDGVRFVYE